MFDHSSMMFPKTAHFSGRVVHKVGSRNLTIYKKGNYGKLFDLPKVPVDPKWIWYTLTFLILVNG